jgi:Uma2 family endonuclease
MPGAYDAGVSRATSAVAVESPERVHIVASRSQLPMRVRPAGWTDDDALYELCRANRDLRIERTAEGELLIMSPTGGETGRRNLGLAGRFWVWAEQDGSGVGFDSSTGFILPNGAERSPDLAWVRLERWEALTVEQREKFPPLCPDFVLELRSPSDDLAELQSKMDEYLEAGASLGWLVDPQARRVHVYRPGRVPEVLDDPREVSGDPTLPGFALRLDAIW